MEERQTDQHRRIAVGEVLVAIGQAQGRAEQGKGQDRRHRTALGQHGPLGRTGRAGGVENGKIAVRIDLDRRRGLAGPGSDHGVETVGRMTDLAAPGDQGQAHRAGMRTNALDLARPGDNDLRAAIVQREPHLLAGPPAIHRHHDRSRSNNAQESRHPFRRIAHRQGDTRARRHAVPVDQRIGKGHRAASQFGIAPALILEHDRRGVAVLHRLHQKETQVRRRIHIGRLPNAQNVGFPDIENLFGSRYLAGDRFQLGPRRRGFALRHAQPSSDSLR